MSDYGFGPGDIINRRVNNHVQQLLPAQIFSQKDYHLEGERFLPSTELSGSTGECLCRIESYVGANSQFEVHEERIFDHQTDNEWRIENTVSRTGAGSLPPFTYSVKSKIEILGDVETKSSRVTWAEFGEEPIYGGDEAQAAVLLTEKMSNVRAREQGNGRSHAGSMSRLGSLSNIVDNDRQLRTDWEAVNELLGPDADTIAATVGFDTIESRDQRLEAEKKGIDFLTDDLESIDGFQTDGKARDGQSQGGQPESVRPAWKTPPAELTAEQTEEELRGLTEEIREMKQDLDEDSSSG